MRVFVFPGPQPQPRPWPSALAPGPNSINSAMRDFKMMFSEAAIGDVM